MPIVDEIMLLLRTVLYVLSEFLLRLTDLVANHLGFIVFVALMVLALKFPVVVIALMRMLVGGLWAIRFLADPRGTRRALNQRRFNREIRCSIERKARKPEPPAGVDELTWLYRQSTLIAEGAITREGENRAIKEYQAMVKAENKWRAENGLEPIEDVTGGEPAGKRRVPLHCSDCDAVRPGWGLCPSCGSRSVQKLSVKKPAKAIPHTRVVATEWDDDGVVRMPTKYEAHILTCTCIHCERLRNDQCL